MANQESGGYKIEIFVKALDPEYKCPICSFVLRIPFQTSCGHRFCESCIKQTIENGSKKCPVDGSPLTFEQIFRDAFCNREIQQLECYCSCKSQGCKWTGQLREIEKEHRNECLFIDLVCPNDGCDVEIQRKLLQKHMTQDCRFKKITCQYCGTEIQERLLQKHQDEQCRKIIVSCFIQWCRKIVNITSYMFVNKVHCLFQFGGCHFKGSRAKLEKHLRENNVEHAYMMETYFVTIRRQIEDLQTREAWQLERQISIRNEVQLRNELEILYSMVESEKKKIRDFLQAAQAASLVGTKEEAAAKPSATEMNGLNKNHDAAGAAKRNLTEINDLKGNLKKVEEQLAKVQIGERQALQTSVQASSVVDQGGSGEANLAMERRMSRMEHQQTLGDVQMAEHDVKITMLETTSYDGAFIWKIEEVARRIQEAVTGKTLSIYSTPFHVGRFGYKVCTRVYLNGDGLGKGTHVSLLFVVMRGEHDALLPWPFQQKVSFKLIDQTGDQHIVDSFRPDPNSSSFQRPTSNMNIASGCPLFVPKSVFHSRGYIKDETLFFKITVDTTGIPGF